MTNKVLDLGEGIKIEILSPIVRGEKGTHVKVFEDLLKNGFSRVRVDSEKYSLSDEIKLEKNKKHNIDIVVDRVVVSSEERSRIFDSIEKSANMANGKVLINVIDVKEILMSENYACPECDFSLPELEPRLFSFNAPYGACKLCKGLGVTQHIDLDLLIPDDSLSILEGGIKTLNLDNNTYMTNVITVAKYYNIDLSKPIKDLSKEEMDIILFECYVFFGGYNRCL